MRSVSIEKNQVVRLLIALLACGVLFLIIHFTTAFADEKDYIIKLSGSTVYTGDQITPQVTSVMYGNEQITDFTVTYGENIDVGKEVGYVYVTIPKTGETITKRFEIKRRSIYIKTENCTKEKGEADPEFTWHLTDERNINPDVLRDLKKMLAEFIQLKRVEGEEICYPSGEIIQYYITFADGVAGALDKVLPNFRIGLDDTYGYLTITKKHITVKAKNGSKTYGENDPPKYEYSIEGNIDPSDYPKLGTITLSRVRGEAAGNYDINVVLQKEETDDYILIAKSGTFLINPAVQPMKVKAKKPSVKYSAKKNRTIKMSKALKFTKKAQGKVTYKKVSGSRFLKINKKTGTITVKKGTPAGTYPITVKILAKGNSNFKPGSKTVKIKIKVKK